MYDALFLPPLSCFALIALGAWIARRKRKLGRGLIAAGIAALVAGSMPIVAALLLRSLQSSPALLERDFDPRCGAIVVLAGDASLEAPEYGAPTCGPMTLERVRYAAYLSRATLAPLLVSGGPPKRDAPAHAEMMKLALERDFAVSVRWVEPHSSNTRTNVAHSTRMLRAAGVERAYLVTHAWHMPRALAEFRAAAFDAVPAPTGFRAAPSFEVSSFLPNAKALRETSWALHEWLGRAWYALTR